MFENIKGAIFDLDGTLVNSMWIWSKIDADFITKNGLGITPEELMKDVAHFSFSETARHFKKTYDIKESLEEIKDFWVQEAEKQYSANIFLKAGARSFLDKLRADGVLMAVATSNTRHLLSVSLQANDIQDYFHTTVTTDETQAKSKSKPDVYLLAAQRLGLKPEELVVFEDIPHAMQGARKAGMKVVGIWDAHTDLSKKEAQNLCDLYIRDFTELLEIS